MPDRPRPDTPPSPWYPTTPPPPGLQQRPRRPARRLVTAASLLIALLISVALTAGTRPPIALPDVPAGAFIGPSGHREFLVDQTGQTRIIETSHLPGAVAFTNAPVAFQAVLPIFGVETAASVYWVAETSEFADGLLPELLSVAGDGLMLHAFEVDGEPYVLSPGVVELPFDAEPDSTWTSEARLRLPDGTVVDFTRTGQAGASAIDGCLDITLTDNYSGSSGTIELTRCPGRGVVAVGDYSTRPFPPSVTGDLDLDTPALMTPQGAPVPLRVHSGDVEINLAATTSPVALGEGLLLANRGNGQLDFAALDAETGRWSLIWRRRPGDQTITMLGAGELAIASTTDRTLVAYDEHGKWRWQADTPDLTTHLIRVDAHNFAALGIDGTLSVRSLDDGRELYSAQVAAGSNLTPVLAPGPAGAVLAVAAGRTLSLADASGQVTTVHLAEPASAMTAHAGQVVLADESAGLLLVGPDGRRAWQTGTPDVCGGLVALDDVIVCSGRSELFGLDAATGALVWREPISALQIARIGEQVLVIGRQTSSLVSADGQATTSWQLDRSSPQVWVVGLGAGLLVVGSDGDTDWWAGQ